MTKHQQPDLNTSPPVADDIRKTTCYMCACRCGINVHMRDGKVKYIEGNRDHPVNKGVLCAKGSAGIMQHYSPARLRAPMKRVGERGSGKFEEITWDEALEMAASWLAPVRESAPEKLAFFTGRDQSQSFTGWWAQQFGTPNYAAHGGFCSVNMAAAGIYTLGGAFWEFGAPDWERTRMFMIFGVAEDHDSNPIKMGLGRLKERGAKIVGVNPVRTGYNAVADEWVSITPGTDGLFIMALIHELLKAGKIDLDYLSRFTNAPVLLDEDGLFARDADGKELVWDRETQSLQPFDTPGLKPALHGSYPAQAPYVPHPSYKPDAAYKTDEPQQSAENTEISEAAASQSQPPYKTEASYKALTPIFEQLANRYLADEFAPENVAERTGVPTATIKRLAAELAHHAFDNAIELNQPWTDFRGERHETMIGRPVSFHAMRGISAHSNGFQTCRALHVLQLLLGSVETPGGFRFKPPYPKPVHGHPRPHAGVTPGKPLDGPHLGYPRGPEDLLMHEDGTAKRIDKAYTWDAPMSAHGMMHMVISNAHAGDPYDIDVLFLYMANMAWNSSMNTSDVMRMLTDKDESGDYKIPKIIYSDAYSSEMVAYADLILPDTTYLERHDCISLLDRPICEPEAAADSIRWPVVEPDRPGHEGVQGFQTTLIKLGTKLGLPGMVNDEGEAIYADYADYIINHQRRPGIGPLAGFRGDGSQAGRGEVNPNQIEAYKENGGFWIGHIPQEAQFYKPSNMAYQNWANDMGLYVSDQPEPYIFQLYVEPMRKFQLAAEGKGALQPPDHLRDRLKQAMDPLPVWYPPFEETRIDVKDYPLHAITQRPAAMYHSWGSQNAWLRQIHSANPLYVSGDVWEEHGFQDGDWATLTSHHGSITVPAIRMNALNPKTVWTWNAIGKRKGAWALDNDAPEATKGFLLNHLIHELLPPKGDGLRWSNSDPVTGQAAWYDLRVRIERSPPQPQTAPDTGAQQSPVGSGPDTLSYGKEWT